MTKVEKIIGKIPIGRGIYSSELEYYEENTTIMFGMSFRALTDIPKNTPPAEINNDVISLINTDKWQILAGSIECANISKSIPIMEDNINSLLSEVYPIILNISISPNGIQKYTGEAKTFNVLWSAKVKEEEIIPTKVTIKVGTEPSYDIDVKNKTIEITTSNDKDVSITVEQGSRKTSKTSKINFAYPSYTGVVSPSFSISEENITSLTEMPLADSKAISYTYESPKLQKIVYAYAKNYGVLSGIVDTNNINLISNYSRSEITINGIAYYVYITTQEFSTNGSITYNYK